MAFVKVDAAGFVCEKIYPQPPALDGWIEAPDDVAPGMLYVDGAFISPPPDPAIRVLEIDDRLAEIDAASLRPLRAIMTDAGGDADRDRLAVLEAEAAALRAERASFAT